MTILDIDNEELDLRGQRIALNADMHQHGREASSESPLFRTFGSRHHTTSLMGYDLILHDDGVLWCNDLMKFHTNDFNKEEGSFLHQLVADGVIDQIGAVAFRIDQRPVVSSKFLTNCITTEDLEIDGAEIISGITFHMINRDSVYHSCDGHSISRPQKCSKMALFDYSKPVFEDCKILFETDVLYKPIRFHGSQEPSHLKGLKSNCTEISIYTLDDFPEELWTLFDDKHVCTVYDGEKGMNVDIPIRTMKKAIAVANNKDRYKLKTRILKLKDGAKLNDILPTQNFENLNRFIIENNNVSIIFMKERHPLTLPVNYSREPEEMLDVKSCVHTKEILDKMYLKTADGWYVVIAKRN